MQLLFDTLYVERITLKSLVCKWHSGTGNGDSDTRKK